MPVVCQARLRCLMQNSPSFPHLPKRRAPRAPGVPKSDANRPPHPGAAPLPSPVALLHKLRDRISCPLGSTTGPLYPSQSTPGRRTDLLRLAYPIRRSDGSASGPPSRGFSPTTWSITTFSKVFPDSASLCCRSSLPGYPRSRMKGGTGPGWSLLAARVDEVKG